MSFVFAVSCRQNDGKVANYQELLALADSYRQHGLINEETRVLRDIYDRGNYNAEKIISSENETDSFDAVIACIRLTLIYESQERLDLAQKWRRNALQIISKNYQDKQSAVDSLDTLIAWVRDQHQYPLSGGASAQSSIESGGAVEANGVSPEE